VKKKSIAPCIVAGFVATIGIGTSHAQQHDGLLKQVLGEIAKGKCPASLMSPLMRGTCETQMPRFAETLAAKGAIKATEFMGMQATPAMGPAEVFKVTFSAGTMMWMINTGPDGKILVLWSP